MLKNSTLFFHKWGLYYKYWHHNEHFLNKYFSNELWFIEEEKTLRIGFSTSLFDHIDVIYDGHSIKGFTFLGLSVTFGYSYNSRCVSDIVKELHNAV